MKLSVMDVKKVTKGLKGSVFMVDVVAGFSRYTKTGKQERLKMISRGTTRAK